MPRLLSGGLRSVQTGWVDSRLVQEPCRTARGREESPIPKATPGRAVMQQLRNPVQRRLMAPYLLALAVTLAVSGQGLSQARQPFSEEAARQLVRAGLYHYFDASSVFEIVLSGAALSGDVLSIDSLLIEGKPAVLRGIRGDVVAQFSGLQVEMASLAGQQAPRITRVRKATVVARATARDMQEALARISPSVINPVVKLQVGQFEVAATVKRGNRSYPVQVRGHLAVVGGQQVRVVLTQAQVFGSDAPPGLIEGELAKVNPVLDLSKWPVSLQIQRLVVHNDRVELLATGGR